jgi:hypothetical protein
MTPRGLTMARKKPETYAVLTVDARTGNGAEACRVGSEPVALKIAALLRYQERIVMDEGKRRRERRYERVTTMQVCRDGSMEQVVVR